jgi:hypothetical protein
LLLVFALLDAQLVYSECITGTIQHFLLVGVQKLAAPPRFFVGVHGAAVAVMFSVGEKKLCTIYYMLQNLPISARASAQLFLALRQ